MSSRESMTPQEEYEFYQDPANLEPVGSPVKLRTSNRLDATVPVRFDPVVLEEVKRRAQLDDRSVSSWIRIAVQRELNRAA